MMKTRGKLLSVGGMLMIGDALAYLLGPTRHIEAWRGTGHVRAYGRVLDWFGQHPAVCAGIAVGEAVAGAALVRRAEAR